MKPLYDLAEAECWNVAHDRAKASKRGANRIAGEQPRGRLDPAKPGLAFEERCKAPRKFSFYGPPELLVP